MEFLRLVLVLGPPDHAGGVEDLHPERLRTTTPRCEIKLDSLTRVEFLNSVRKHLFSHEAVLVARIGYEAETAFRVIPLDFADRHWTSPFH